MLATQRLAALAWLAVKLRSRPREPRGSGRRTGRRLARSRGPSALAMDARPSRDRRSSREGRTALHHTAPGGHGKRTDARRLPRPSLIHLFHRFDVGLTELEHGSRTTPLPKHDGQRVRNDGLVLRHADAARATLHTLRVVLAGIFRVDEHATRFPYEPALHRRVVESSDLSSLIARKRATPVSSMSSLAVRIGAWIGLGDTGCGGEGRLRATGVVLGTGDSDTKSVVRCKINRVDRALKIDDRSRARMRW